jgi:hypothetical protein
MELAVAVAVTTAREVSAVAESRIAVQEMVVDMPQQLPVVQV